MGKIMNSAAICIAVTLLLIKFVVTDQIQGTDKVNGPNRPSQTIANQREGTREGQSPGKITDFTGGREAIHQNKPVGNWRAGHWKHSLLDILKSTKKINGPDRPTLITENQREGSREGQFLDKTTNFTGVREATHQNKPVGNWRAGNGKHFLLDISKGEREAIQPDKPEENLRAGNEKHPIIDVFNRIREEYGTKLQIQTIRNLKEGNSKDKFTDRFKRNTEGEICPPKMYGTNCDMKCPSNCHGNCKRNSGVCSGCQDDGQHGERCNNFCAHCIDQHCLFKDGTCIKGINSSYVHNIGQNTTNQTIVSGNKTEVVRYSVLLSPIFVVIVILVFLHVWFGVPPCLHSCLPAWYPRGGFRGLRRDHIERSRVQERELQNPIEQPLNRT